MSSLQYFYIDPDCQFMVGYRHISFSFSLCLECFHAVRQSNLHKNYVRFSSLVHSMYTQCDLRQQQTCLANGKLADFVSQQIVSLKELIRSNAIEKCFLVKEFQENSAKLSLSTNDDSESSKESAENAAVGRKSVIAERCGEVVNELMLKMQPSKQVFLKKTESLWQSAVSAKQKCQMIRSEYKTLAAELPTMRSIKKGLNGFLKFF